MSGLARGGETLGFAGGETASPVARNLWLLHGAVAAHFAAGLMGTTIGPVLFVTMTGRPELAGVAPATFIVAGAVAAQVGGFLMDRLGRIPVLFAGFLVGALGFAGAAIAIRQDTPAILVSSFALQGAATGVVMLARLAAADMRPPELQPRAVATVLSGAIPGAIAAAVVFPLMDRMGAWPWIVGACVMLLGALIVLGVRPEPKLIAEALVRVGGGRQAPMWQSQVDTRTTPVGGEIGATLLGWLGCHAPKMALVPLAGMIAIRTGHSPRDAYPMVAAHMVGMFLFILFVGEIVQRMGSLRASPRGAGADHPERRGARPCPIGLRPRCDLLRPWRWVEPGKRGSNREPGTARKTSLTRASSRSRRLRGERPRRSARAWRWLRSRQQERRSGCARRGDARHGACRGSPER